MLGKLIAVLSTGRQGHHHTITIKGALLSRGGRRDDTGVKTKVEGNMVIEDTLRRHLEPVHLAVQRGRAGDTGQCCTGEQYMVDERAMSSPPKSRTELTMGREHRQIVSGDETGPVIRGPRAVAPSARTYETFGTVVVLARKARVKISQDNWAGAGRRLGEYLSNPLMKCV
jgi:hypothetical protein